MHSCEPHKRPMARGQVVQQFRIKIIGAGSIGNHMAQASRSLGWDVTVTDIDSAALSRMKKEIYPARYGSWDEDIKLGLNHEIPAQDWDVVVIGTPPDSHLELATEVLRNESCRVLLVEKPFCTPSLHGFKSFLDLVHKKNVRLVVGYNHCTTANTSFVEDILKREDFGEPVTMTCNIREHWEGIFKAHPWLSGPQESYLGFFERGGGACGEHSHGINIWQYMASLLNLGRIEKVSAEADFVYTEELDYDRWMSVNVVTEKGFKGHILQDVVTKPAQKNLRIQFTDGFIEWYVNYQDGKDCVRYQTSSGAIIEKLFPKKRPDDFIPEFQLIHRYLNESLSRCEFEKLERWGQVGLESMMVISAAYQSALSLAPVRVSYAPMTMTKTNFAEVGL